MNAKRKLTATLLTICLLTGATALASGAPSSQFGFKGWPYRQGNGCATTCQPEITPPSPVEPTATPVPTEAPVPTPAPTTEPTATPVPTPAPTTEPSATPVPTAEPTATPVPTAEPTPTAKPSATPAPTGVPTSNPAATPRPQHTETPSETEVPPFTDEDYTTGSITAQEENAFLLLNEDRAANGRAALELDPALCDLARLKSRDMFLNNYFSHTSPTYGSAAQMLSSYGYAFTSVGENIAHHATVEKAQAAFMSSSGHRQNILGSQWTKVGIGVWEDSQGFVYVTQLFVR